MVIARAKSAQQHTALVRLVIPIGVLEEEELCAMPDVNAAIAQLDAGRNHKTAGKDGGFVAPAVLIRILQDQDLVVRSLTRFDLWINGAADDPQPAARVKAHLDRFDHAVFFEANRLASNPSAIWNEASSVAASALSAARR